MKPIQMPENTSEQLEALGGLYPITKDIRLRQPVQPVLLAVEKGLVAEKLVKSCG